MPVREGLAEGDFEAVEFGCQGCSAAQEAKPFKEVTRLFDTRAAARLRQVACYAMSPKLHFI
jgi:hypothetical protein